MNKNPRPALSVGDIVEATAGRGSGRKFLVVETVDGEYVRISDGDTRKLSRAKLKKNLHLRPIGRAVDTEFLTATGGTADSEIRKLLKYEQYIKSEEV